MGTGAPRLGAIFNRKLSVSALPPPAPGVREGGPTELGVGGIFEMSKM